MIVHAQYKNEIYNQNTYFVILVIIDTLEIPENSGLFEKYNFM